jgi:hypothetical protein
MLIRSEQKKETEKEVVGATVSREKAEKADNRESAERERMLVSRKETDRELRGIGEQDRSREKEIRRLVKRKEAVRQSIDGLGKDVCARCSGQAVLNSRCSINQPSLFRFPTATFRP